MRGAQASFRRRRFLQLGGFGTLSAVLEACRTSAPPLRGDAAPSASVATSSPASSVPAPSVGLKQSLRPLGTRVSFDPAHPAFAADAEDFEPKRPPGPDDWLSRFPHTQVSFDEYVALEPTGRDGSRQRLVLAPVGRFPATATTLLEVLRTFTEAYFDVPTRIAPHQPLPALERRTRIRAGQQYTQYRTSAILDHLLAPQLPSDAICLLGITFDDLYPEPDWNFAFGEATLDERVGVYSLARFFREFRRPPASPNSDRVGLERSLKVLGHETGHMFSLHHCRTHECLMNGTNSLDETDRSPLHLGPHCLKKLQYDLRFDIPSRYGRLQAFYAKHGLREEAQWVGRRLRRLGRV